MYKYYFSVNLHAALNILRVSWQKITAECIINCFAHYGFRRQINVENGERIPYDNENNTSVIAKSSVSTANNFSATYEQLIRHSANECNYMLQNLTNTLKSTMISRLWKY